MQKNHDNNINDNNLLDLFHETENKKPREVVCKNLY